MLARIASLIAVAFVALPLAAEDSKPATKEVTLTGTMHCAKCGLKMTGIKKCTNALIVKDGDKMVTYLFDDKGSDEDYHDGLCGGGKKENVAHPRTAYFCTDQNEEHAVS